MSDTVEGTAEEVELEFQMLIKKIGSQVELVAVDEETRPETLDDVYAAICIVKRNLEAQQVAAVTQQVMMQTAEAMRQQIDPDGEKTESGIVIPGNKNIR